MPVYVDSLFNYGWKHGSSCHLIADRIGELKAFAVKIGMRPEWYQANSSPHFDLTAEGRSLAVKLGAIELDRRAFVAKIQELRRKGWPE
jgi:hypothetical protein